MFKKHKDSIILGIFVVTFLTLAIASSVTQASHENEQNQEIQNLKQELALIKDEGCFCIKE